MGPPSPRRHRDEACPPLVIPSGAATVVLALLESQESRREAQEATDAADATLWHAVRLESRDTTSSPSPVMVADEEIDEA